MLRRQFLPPERTTYPHSSICEPAGQQATAKSSLLHHAVGSQQAARFHQQCVLSQPADVDLVRIPREVFVRTTCVEHSTGMHRSEQCERSRYRHGCDPPRLHHFPLTYVPPVSRQWTSSSFRLRRIPVSSCRCVETLTLASSALGLLACDRGGGMDRALQRDLYERSQ